MFGGLHGSGRDSFPSGAGARLSNPPIAQQYLRDIESSGRDIRPEVDGGIKVNNIAQVASAGADTFVAGSAIFNQPDYAQVIDAMRAELANVG